MKRTSFAVVFLIILLISAFAEEAEPAILARGPVAHEGIEFLGVNTILAQYGEYRYTEDLIRLYYTAEPIYLSDHWDSGYCDSADIKKLKTSKGISSADVNAVFAYTDKKGWTVFLSFPSDAEYICDFIDKYRIRQNYFLNIARDETLFSFPAILDIE